MDPVLDAINKTPMATIITLAGIVCIVISLVSGALTIDQALVALGAIAGGSGVLGVARNGAGRGLHGHDRDVMTPAQAEQRIK